MNTDTCERADSTLNTLRVDGNILNPERKRCGFKNIQIRVDGA